MARIKLHLAPNGTIQSHAEACHAKRCMTGGVININKELFHYFKIPKSKILKK
jgi:hypothetical protein